MSNSRRAVLTVILAGAVLASACHDSHGARPSNVGVGQSSTLPIASKTTTTTTAVPPVFYVVEQGDTLTAIAQHFRVSVNAIVKANHLGNPDDVAAGRRLRIPSPLPVKLVVTPSAGSPGQSFQLRLTGAQPNELVTFEVRSSTHTFTGPPHQASADGTVTATYNAGASDPTGTFEVRATGKKSTSARTSFTVSSKSSRA